MDAQLSVLCEDIRDALRAQRLHELASPRGPVVEERRQAWHEDVDLPRPAQPWPWGAVAERLEALERQGRRQDERLARHDEALRDTRMLQEFAHAFSAGMAGLQQDVGVLERRCQALECLLQQRGYRPRCEELAGIVGAAVADERRKEFEASPSDEAQGLHAGTPGSTILEQVLTVGSALEAARPKMITASSCRARSRRRSPARVDSSEFAPEVSTAWPVPPQALRGSRFDGADGLEPQRACCNADVDLADTGEDFLAEHDCAPIRSSQWRCPHSSSSGRGSTAPSSPGSTGGSVVLRSCDTTWSESAFLGSLDASASSAGSPLGLVRCLAESWAVSLCDAESHANDAVALDGSPSIAAARPHMEDEEEGFGGVAKPLEPGGRGLAGRMPCAGLRLPAPVLERTGI